MRSIILPPMGSFKPQTERGPPVERTTHTAPLASTPDPLSFMTSRCSDLPSPDPFA